jgi:hypothetical protein
MSPNAAPSSAPQTGKRTLSSIAASLVREFDRDVFEPDRRVEQGRREGKSRFAPKTARFRLQT